MRTPATIISHLYQLAEKATELASVENANTLDAEDLKEIDRMLAWTDHRLKAAKIKRSTTSE